MKTLVYLPISIGCRRGQQPPTNPKSRLVCWICCLATVCCCYSCHRSQVRSMEIGTAAEAYRTPQATFATWVAASQIRDRDAVLACYWQGLVEQERRSWLEENLRPEAVEFFIGAAFESFQLISPVMGRFTFRIRNGAETGSGIMVRTNGGWKIQSW